MSSSTLPRMVNPRYSKPYKKSRIHASIEVNSMDKLGEIKMVDG